MRRAAHQYLVDPCALQPMWPERPGVPGRGVPPEPAVDEGQRHRGHAGPHLHCQRGGLRTGVWGLFAAREKNKSALKSQSFHVCVWHSPDHRARAEAGRGWYPCVREEQEGVHWANGEVAYRERSGPADGKPGPRLLWGTALSTDGVDEALSLRLSLL